MGIRKNFCTHDSLAMIYHDVGDRHPNNQQLRAMVTVDLKKTYDTVPHEAVVSSMYEEGLEEKQLDFFCSFLAGRRYLVKLGDGPDARSSTTKEKKHWNPSRSSGVANII
ncbi:hypothetical protein IscW_ISCW015549 [Ixodes scapularis]|uniref:Uncharacterized protein n=1 Tax=Ixodes scapularis TaxID=6945 RepID=B7QN60_IXOSC|nr:hypothetical protein IscW_ISCW015549 [Ixodes scapularis]|eukprot:XP_002400728.1 hypothetical protein IscW_ISCW015549 [Ixodes scapularis]